MAVSLIEVPAIWILARESMVDDELAQHGGSAHMSK
jgi:hypothetical protein